MSITAWIWIGTAFALAWLILALRDMRAENRARREALRKYRCRVGGEKLERHHIVISRNMN